MLGKKLIISFALFSLAAFNIGCRQAILTSQKAQPSGTIVASAPIAESTLLPAKVPIGVAGSSGVGTVPGWSPLLGPLLTIEQSGAIAEAIYQNEAGGKRDQLAFWNAQESFPSLGIAHWIWFPANADSARARFGGDKFPGLIRFLIDRGEVPPDVIKKTLPALVCPWVSRQDFLSKTSEVESVRNFLEKTKGSQSVYLIQTLSASIQAIAKKAQDPKSAEDKIKRISSGSSGPFPLVDYINFKGDGLDTGSTGWGLLQVIDSMSQSGDPVLAFAKAADEVLTRRVAANPKDGTFLEGWRVRIYKYSKFKMPGR